MSFWVESGNYDYVPPSGYKVHLFTEVHIANADDFKDTDFACVMGRNWKPVNITIDYSDYTKVLTLRHKDGIPFNEINFIKFGNSGKD